MLFETEFDYKNYHIDVCHLHKDYKVMKKPTTDCEQCRILWQLRCQNELTEKDIVVHEAESKAINLDTYPDFSNIILFWDRSGKCVAIAADKDNFWFSVPNMDYFRYGVTKLIK